MKHESLQKLLWGPLSVLLLVALLATVGTAQDPPKKPAAGPGKPAAGAPKEVKKLRGRLPTYYGKVVDDKQRQEIYKIQALYNEQIEKLKEQLESIVKKRDTEVEQVLTDEQRAEVAKLKEARRTRRTSSSDEENAAGGQ